MTGKPAMKRTTPSTARKLSPRAIAAINDFARRSVIAQIEALEHVAYERGLLITARALNQAKNACGWEIAGNAGLAAKAAVGKRAGER